MNRADQFYEKISWKIKNSMHWSLTISCRKQKLWPVSVGLIALTSSRSNRRKMPSFSRNWSSITYDPTTVHLEHNVHHRSYHSTICSHSLPVLTYSMAQKTGSLAFVSCKTTMRVFLPVNFTMCSPIFGRPYYRSSLWYSVSSVCRLSVRL